MANSPMGRSWDSPCDRINNFIVSLKQMENKKSMRVEHPQKIKAETLIIYVCIYLYVFAYIVNISCSQAGNFFCLMSMILGCWQFRTCVNKYEFPTMWAKMMWGGCSNQVSVLLNHQSVRFTMSGMPM